MKKLFLALSAVGTLTIGIPAQAAVISIDDTIEPTISLFVNQPFQITTPGNPPPGGGIPGSMPVTQALPAVNNFAALVVPTPQDINHEIIEFTFQNQFSWPQNVYQYQYYTEQPGGIGSNGLSDLFVIQGRGGTTPDIVTFISATDLTGDIAIDGPSNLTGATPTQISPPVLESGNWQLAFDTGVDQYYIRSDVSEPASLALLSVALLGFGFARRKWG